MGKNHPLVLGCESQLGPSAYYCNIQFPILIQATVLPQPQAMAYCREFSSEAQAHTQTRSTLSHLETLWCFLATLVPPHPKPGLDLEAEKVI